MTIASSPGKVPQSLPLTESPSAVLQFEMTPRATATTTESATSDRPVADSDEGTADPTDGAPGGVVGLAGTGSGAVEDGAGEVAATAAVEAADGTLGPRRTPARRGHATPSTKPMAAMTPTLVHDG